QGESASPAAASGDLPVEQCPGPTHEIRPRHERAQSSVPQPVRLTSPGRTCQSFRFWRSSFGYSAGTRFTTEVARRFSSLLASRTGNVLFTNQLPHPKPPSVSPRKSSVYVRHLFHPAASHLS